MFPIVLVTQQLNEQPHLQAFSLRKFRFEKPWGQGFWSNTGSLSKDVFERRTSTAEVDLFHS